ncbi:MAG: Fpg/Nei family DNA glycosylase [Janthinobacterium lividum]
MPEGHTIHRLARVFETRFRGRVVAASSPQGRFAAGAAVLDGLRLASAEARGKHLFLRFEDSERPEAAPPVWLRVHLGLYGGWRFAGPGLAGEGGRKPAAAGTTATAGAAYDASAGRADASQADPGDPDSVADDADGADPGEDSGGVDLASARLVAASGTGEGERIGQDGADGAWPPEPRGLVRLRLLAGDRIADLSGPAACVIETPDGRVAAMARLGEDPLRDDADADAAGRRVRASRSAVGLLLMRQDLVAGIGNIYRAEVLFRAGIDPHRPGREVTEAEWRALWADLRALMQDGVSRGRIVTTRPEHRASGRRGGAVKRGDASYVAHRAGQPCRVCATPVRAEAMGGRTLYWCEACQPA